jgi:uncharacterized membrane protein
LRDRTFNGLRGCSGKPLHPPLTDVPIAAYLLTASFDVLSVVGGDDHRLTRELWHAGSFTLAAAVIASVVGLADARSSSSAGTQVRRTINPHASITVVALTLAVAELGWRFADYDAEVVIRMGITVLSVAIAVLVALGATFGGTLLFDYGSNVEKGRGSPVWHSSEDDLMPSHRSGPRSGPSRVSETAAPRGSDR